MKNLILNFILLSFGFLNALCTSPHVSVAEKTVNHLISEIEQKLTQKYHMRAIGITIGMPGGIVKKLGISFQLQGPLSKKELRKLLVSSVQDFADSVNADQDIQPFLEKRPFGIESVEIVFFLVDANGYEVDDPHIGIAGISKGILDYKTLITVNNIPKDVTKENETYEEALKIVQEQAADHNNPPI